MEHSKADNFKMDFSDVDYTRIILILIPLFIAYKIYQRNKVHPGLKNMPTLSTRKHYSALLNGAGPEKRWEDVREPLEREGIAKIWLNGKWHVLVTDLELSKDLFTKTDLFPKFSMEEVAGNSLFADHYGENVALSSGDDWKRHRRAINPAFRHLPIQPFAESAMKLLEVMEKMDNKPVEVKELMDRLTLDVLGKVGFGFDFNNLDDPTNVYVTAYQEAISEISNPIYFLFPFLGYITSRSNARKKVEKLNNIYDEIIESKRKSMETGELAKQVNDKTADLLGYMVYASNDPENPSLTKEELRHNVAIFMLAGHDTTSNALSSILYILASQKDIQQKLRDEVLRVLGDDLVPSLEQQKKLRYLELCLKENLRFFPPVTSLAARDPVEDVKFRNHIIPAHTQVEPFVYGVHHSSKIWKDHDKFIPERYDNEKYDHYAWLGFGAGNRACIGNSFSLMEQRIMVCALLRKYEISLPEGSIHKEKLQVGPTASGTMGPSPDLYLNFKRRTE